MTIFLICLVFVSAGIGFFFCALLQVAADADRREEELYAEWQRNRDESQEVAN